MSKIMLVGDSHWGISNNNQRMVQQSITVWNYILDLAKDYKCDAIIEAGDFLDKRKEIDAQLLDTIRTNLINRLEIPLYMTVGNHNLYYKDTSTVNNISIFESLSNYCHVVDKPTSVYGIDIIPWVTKDNVETITTYIKNSHNKYCVGHWELNGFQFDKSRISDVKEVISKSLLNKYTKVFSGHYHIRSEKDNVLYIGTPYQLTWIDVDVEKYVYILDTESGDLVELITSFELYKQFSINENNWKEYCNDQLKDKLVKIFYEESFDKRLFNDVQTQFIQVNPNIQFIKKPSKEKKQKQIVIDETQSLLDSVLDYVKNTQQTDSDKIEILLKKVYNIVNTTQN